MRAESIFGAGVNRAFRGEGIHVLLSYGDLKIGNRGTSYIFSENILDYCGSKKL